ncbi:autotransporter outer membrane beta-barrel domain-containing protein [Escherichia coli]|nr:autotransporter outer membrane beta-barrel domain-containing protein [Escherichia coli]
MSLGHGGLKFDDNQTYIVKGGNEYTASFAGLGTKNYSSHSRYAGAEVGYRYHVTEDAWIEPQAELVYGAVMRRATVHLATLIPSRNN